jgi:hypothetical protein
MASLPAVTADADAGDASSRGRTGTPWKELLISGRLAWWGLMSSQRARPAAGGTTSAAARRSDIWSHAVELLSTFHRRDATLTSWMD